MEQIGILIGTMLGACIKTAAPAMLEIFKQCCLIWREAFDDTVEDGATRPDLRNALLERVRDAHGAGAPGRTSPLAPASEERKDLDGG